MARSGYARAVGEVGGDHVDDDDDEGEEIKEVKEEEEGEKSEVGGMGAVQDWSSGNPSVHVHCARKLSACAGGASD